MRSAATVRRVAGAAGAAALVGMGLLSACGGKDPDRGTGVIESRTGNAVPTEKVLTRVRTPAPIRRARSTRMSAPPAQTVLPRRRTPAGDAGP